MHEAGQVGNGIEGGIVHETIHALGGELAIRSGGSVGDADEIGFQGGEAFEDLVQFFPSPGVAAMPGWAVQPYLDRGYVAHRPVRKRGLETNLYAATTTKLSGMAYMVEFIATMKQVSFTQLEGITPVGARK